MSRNGGLRLVDPHRIPVAERQHYIKQRYRIQYDELNGDEL
jgi:hypothetical protein